MNTPADRPLKLGAQRELSGSVSAFLADLYPHMTIVGDVSLIATPKGDAVLVLKPFDDHIIVDKLISVDRGAGRAAMEMVVAAADKHQVTLDLTACPLESTTRKTLTKRALEKFYAEFGFKQHGYRNSNGHARMKRQPQ